MEVKRRTEERRTGQKERKTDRHKARVVDFRNDDPPVFRCLVGSLGHHQA